MVIQRMAPSTITMMGNAVHGLVRMRSSFCCHARRPVAAAAGDAALGDARGLAVDRLGDAVVQILRQLPAQFLGVFEDFFGRFHEWSGALVEIRADRFGERADFAGAHGVHDLAVAF